jgi:hypothetical protein
MHDSIAGSLCSFRLQLCSFKACLCCQELCVSLDLLGLQVAVFYFNQQLPGFYLIALFNIYFYYTPRQLAVYAYLLGFNNTRKP